VDEASRKRLTNLAVKQGAPLAAGVVMGAIAKHTITPRPHSRGGLPLQVGSAIGAAAANGAGASGALVAGASVVTAKVAAVTAAASAGAVAVAPFVAAAGAVYGVYRLFKWLDE